MATLYAYPLAPNVGAGGSIDLSKRVRTNFLTPRVTLVEVYHTMLGTEAAADVVRLFRAYQGMKIIPHLSMVIASGAIGATATVDVGDEDAEGVGALADADRYCDGANVAAANARVLFSATGNPPAAVNPYEIGATQAWITATFATLVTPVAGSKLRFLIAVSGA